jgi:hypothetical protein
MLGKDHREDIAGGSAMPNPPPRFAEGLDAISRPQHRRERRRQAACIAGGGKGQESTSQILNSSIK